MSCALGSFRRALIEVQFCRELEGGGPDMCRSHRVFVRHKYTRGSVVRRHFVLGVCFVFLRGFSVS